MRRWSAYCPNTDDTTVRMRVSRRGSYQDTIRGSRPLRSCRCGLSSMMFLPARARGLCSRLPMPATPPRTFLGSPAVATQLGMSSGGRWCEDSGNEWQAEGGSALTRPPARLLPSRALGRAFAPASPNIVAYVCDAPENGLGHDRCWHHQALVELEFCAQTPAQGAG